MGSCQSLSLPASTLEREPKNHPAAEALAVEVRGVMPLFPGDVSLTLPVPEEEPPEERAR